MFNHIGISGRLVADPELKHVGAEDVPVVNFRIANDTGWGDNKKANFFNVTAWRGLATSIANHKKKGEQIIVSGELQQRDYDDAQGNKRSAVEILARDVEFVSRGGGGQTAYGDNNAQASGGSTASVSIGADEDVPF